MKTVFEGNTANEAWLNGLSSLHNCSNALLQDSRLGPTREILHSSFIIRNPRERWVISRAPAMNPAFAIAEVFWILAGMNESKFINFWNPSLTKFAGKGSIYHGAYGERLRKRFGFDQLIRAADTLRSNPNSRQVVLQIWDPRDDFPNNDGSPVAEDIPCNICAMPKVRNGRLEWLQVMRSNDLFLGSPHNFVQFTSLQEIMAGWLECDVGSYVQVADSLHCYEKDITNFGQEEIKYNPQNSDDLRLTFKEFEVTFTQSINILRRLVSDDLTKYEIRKLPSHNIQPSYLNMLLICAVDSARRRRWGKEMRELITYCTNPILVEMWARWLDRCTKNKSTG